MLAVRINGALLQSVSWIDTDSLLDSFENKQYAQLDIVKTEKKGFGVRTVNDLYT